LKAKQEEMALLMQQSIQENEKLMADKKRLEKKLRDVNSNNLDDAPDICQLQDRICQLESELNELKQSNSDSKQDTAQDVQVQNLQQMENTHKHQMSKLQQQWDQERSSLREEIQRLNLENSRYRNGNEVASNENDNVVAGDDDDEDDEWTKRYQLSTNQSTDRAETLVGIEELIHSSSHESKGNTNNQTSSNGTPTTEFDSSDMSCLQSIISTLRQTIHQLTNEKEALHQQLTEEQTRSQQELQSFAKTLEGVDDLRSSAERMGRELRRIKVKGYRPVRSDLLNNNSSSHHSGTLYSEEFETADEASREMEEAIRLIECQNDALNDRWSGRTNVNEIKVFSSEYKPKRASMSSTEGESKCSLMKISEDECDDGFMSYWRKDEDTSTNLEEGEKKKEKKAKEKRRKKKPSSGGSVFSSFF
jgi:hypothetical protein